MGNRRNLRNDDNKRNIRWVSTAEAAQMLGVTTNTVRRWILQGKIRGKKIIGRWKIPAEEIDRLLNQ